MGDRAGRRSAETDDPRWLDADELAAFRAFMDLAWRLPAELDCALQRDAQLSFMEYYVLALLAEAPEQRIRMSRLAIKVNAELSRLSHMIKRLEKRDLVRRETDPADGRYTDAVLTDVGRVHQANAAPGHVDRVRDLFVDVLDSDEMQTIRRCAQKVITRIDDRPGTAR